MWIDTEELKKELQIVLQNFEKQNVELQKVELPNVELQNVTKGRIT